MRVAINLLNDDPDAPSGAVQFWTHVIPEMALRLGPDERLLLLVSPKNRHFYPGYGPQVEHLVFPWSNERPILRTLCEQFWVPVALPRHGVDVFNTGIAPLANPWKLVLHIKTMHAFATPGDLPFLSRHFRRLAYPRGARRADAIIVNSLSLRDEVERYLHVPREKLHLVYEAVDHALFGPSASREEERKKLAPFGLDGPFVLFLSSLWRYKNADGLLRAFALARDRLAGRKLAIVGFPRDAGYVDGLKKLVGELGLGDHVVFCGGVPHEKTATFYQAADLFVYPSFNETFGLTLLEAMACGCPVVTSNRSAMPEIAGDAALLADPADPRALARAMLEALEPGTREALIRRGYERAKRFTWGACAEGTLAVFRRVMGR